MDKFAAIDKILKTVYSRVMIELSPILQTLYADLVQQTYSAEHRPGTIYEQTSKGAKYIYVKRQVGSARVDQFLGPANDPDTRQTAQHIRTAQTQARARRGIVRSLRDNGVPVPPRAMGRVLDAISDAGLFEHFVLVGTAAYVCFSPVLGAILPAATVTTQDVDLATVSLAASASPPDRRFLDVLKLADPSFRAVPALTPGAPSAAFRSSTGYIVDLLTVQRRRSDSNPMPLKSLQAGAVPMQHLDWLVENPVRAIALHGAGVPVRIPQPARFAVHKLIIAQKRNVSDRLKRQKDLLQAAALLDILGETDPHDLQDTLNVAVSKGIKGWKQPILRSLKELNRGLDEFI